jgi:hypothetical protein
MNTTLRMRGFVVLIVLTAGLAACAGADAVLGPLVILTNSWRDEATALHTFNIQDNTGFQAKRSGTFTGTETLPSGATFQLEGFWSENGSIQFTVHRSPDVTYRGTIPGDNANRLPFTSPAGNLVLLRN